MIRYQLFGCYPLEVFVNNTNLTSLYEIDVEVFQKVSAKNKVPSQLTIHGLADTYPTMLICHALPVSDIQTLKSCLIESRNDLSPKSEVVHETEFPSLLTKQQSK